MTEIELRVIIDPGVHWMLYVRRIATFSKTISVDDINAIKFSHTEKRSCLFSSSSETYDAICYGTDILRLFFDLKTGRYIAKKRYVFSQGPYYKDHVGFWRKKEYADWKMTESEPV